jgi:hypothetical protein
MRNDVIFLFRFEPFLRCRLSVQCHHHSTTMAKRR